MPCPVPRDGQAVLGGIPEQVGWIKKPELENLQGLARSIERAEGVIDPFLLDGRVAPDEGLSRSQGGLRRVEGTDL